MPLPATAGSATGARPSVVWRAVRDFWGLRLRLGGIASGRCDGSRPIADLSHARPASTPGGRVNRRGGPSRRSSVPGSPSRELTNSRKTDSFDSSTGPTIAIGAGRMVRLDTGSIEHARGRKDAGARANRQRERVGRSRVDFDLPVAHVEHEPGVERLVGEVRDDHLAHGRPEGVEDHREQVVGERPLRHLALELHGDRAGLPLPDPDGQVAIPLELTQITTRWVESMWTRTLSTDISISRPTMGRLSHSPAGPDS